MKIKNTNNFEGDFVGQTPNLNSSLGVNAFDAAASAATAAASYGATAATQPATQDQSKLDSFWTKNQNVLTGLGGAVLGGLFGTPAGTTSPSGTPYTSEKDEKKGMPAWAWILIIVAVLLIIFFIVKAAKK